MSEMKNRVRFIHSSDWQLGMTRHFFDDESASRFSQARIDAITKLGQLAKQHDAQFMVVAGDVFESNQLNRQTLTRTLEALKSVSVPVFLLPGNHDPLNGASIFAAPEFQNVDANLFVLRDMEPIAVPGLSGVEVVGAPWRTVHPSTDLCNELIDTLEPAKGLIRVAVAHGQTDSIAPDISRPEIINLANAEAAIEQQKFHYLGLGDRHSMKQIGTSGRIWYSGAPVATAFDEVDPNKALLVELERDGDCEVQPLEVGEWQFIAEQYSINGPEDLAQFASWLKQVPNKVCSAVKVGFEGSINLATATRLDALMESNAELFASLRKRERTTDLAIVPDEMDEDSVSLSGYAHDSWVELLNRARGGDAAAADALSLLYRLGEQGGEL
jgi:DNA repair exonuclease SbcCD nuclease subunit